MKQRDYHVGINMANNFIAQAQRAKMQRDYIRDYNNNKDGADHDAAINHTNNE